MKRSKELSSCHPSALSPSDEKETTMNRIVLGLFCLGLIAGCSSKGSDKGKVEIQLVQPEQKVKPGNEYTFSIKAVAIEGKGFKGKVKVAIETPEGVSVEPKSFEIDLSEKGSNSKDCTLSIDTEVEKGDKTIKITSTPDGEPADVKDMKITVE
jgi:uncharacterized membrane protein